MDFELVVLVDVDVDDDLVGGRKVFGEVDFHLSVAKALVGVVFLDYLLGAVDDVLCYLVAAVELEGVVEVFLLAFLHTYIID